MRSAYFISILILISSVGRAQSLYFPPTTGGTWDTLSPSSLSYCDARIDSLYSFLDSNNTKAFILLKDGKIVLEKYFGSHTQSSLWQWASAAKTITAFITGIAQQEGYLKLSDTSSKYLGKGWTSCTEEQEDRINIRHQLSMSSGLDDAVPDHFCTLDTCLLYKADAGTRWAYHNGPYTLLDGVIENATGNTLNEYTTLKLKNPTGMTGSFIPVNYNNIYVSNARSMARFGLLILNKGNWNGSQIMTDQSFFNEMTNTSQSLNKAYGYLWWLNGKQSFMVPSSQFVFSGSLFPQAPPDMISAIGKGGQFLNIIPSQNMIWLRMGEEPNNALVPFLLNGQIWDYVNALTCNTNGLQPENTVPSIQLFPNPSANFITIRSNNLINKIQILTIDGTVLQSFDAHNTETELPLKNLPHGLYYLKAHHSSGVWLGKFMKE